MSVALNHTIVFSEDNKAAAEFFADVFGLPAPKPFGPFLQVETANGVGLDFMTRPAPVAGQHYAFLVSEPEFDAIFARVRQRGLSYWADPHQQQPKEINTHDGGRGVYFPDPSGHMLEILTVPYGGSPC
jgi:catechol 2,3-dioxygenase-like lactoylglutathione lyase family enzyme